MDTNLLPWHAPTIRRHDDAAAADLHTLMQRSLADLRQAVGRTGGTDN